MSFFLESATINKKDNKNTNKSFNFNGVENSCLKFNEALAYGEIAWQNLTIKAMNEEYMILKEDDSPANKNETLIEKIKRWFKEIITWIKNRFNDIKNFAKNVISSLGSGFEMINVYAKQNKDKIIKGGKILSSKGEKITLTKWSNGSKLQSPKNILANFANIERKANSMFDKGEATTKMNNFQDVSNTIEGIIDKNQSTQEVSFDTTLVNSAIQIASEATKCVMTIKNIMKQTSKTAEECNRTASTGANTNDVNKAQELKTKVSNLKSKFVFENKCTSAIVRLVNKAVKDAHKVNVACVKANKNPADTTQKSVTTQKALSSGKKALPAGKKALPSKI